MLVSASAKLFLPPPPPQVVGLGAVGEALERQGLLKALVLLGLCQNSKLTCGIIRADAM